MRVAWVALVLTACHVPPPRDDPPDYTWPPPITPDGNPYDGLCHADADCAGDVCARTGECLPASLVQAVRVTWTISGAPANLTSCAAVGDLAIEFT
nr:hypothetical protein [Deltaproteobacteria bacterium]